MATKKQLERALEMLAHHTAYYGSDCPKAYKDKCKDPGNVLVKYCPQCYVNRFIEKAKEEK